MGTAAGFLRVVTSRAGGFGAADGLTCHKAEGEYKLLITDEDGQEIY